ncbi:hypothetical protein Tco_0213931 [Tanacetum coccineum]
MLPGSIPNTMLDRTNFASWQQRIRLYCQGKENGVNILKLIDEGPFHVGTTRGHSLPTGNNKIWITLTFLATTPTSRVTKGHLHSYQSFYDAKEYAICEDALGRTKEKLFMTTMSGLPNSSMTSVKLNRGLRDSNYDQLYAYLKQHEAHVNKNKMMLDQFTQHTMDPLSLMSNVSYQQYYSQSSTTPPSIYVPPYFADNTPLDLGLSPTDNLIENLTNTLALLTQSYKTYLRQTNNQLKTSSNTRN